MNSSRLVRLLASCAALAASHLAKPQQPFDLDQSFRTDIDTWYVSSMAPLNNGDLLISGEIRFPGELDFRGLARITAQGAEVAGFSNFYGGGKLTPWNDQFYVASSQTVRRLLSTGLLDASFIHMNSGPYFSSLQGGDYHVFPDGRVVMGGIHQLNDTVRGYEGYYCLCWFSNEGYLDTTRVHRTCSGSLNVFQQLPNGQFIGSGSTSTYDGQPASRIFRFNADGSLDPSFQANVVWGQAYGFLPLDDGRVYAAGEFRVQGVVDTLRLVRFMPDGQLDPSFNNALSFILGEIDGAFGAIPSFIYPLEPNRLVVTGAFRSVAGLSRKSICAVDTLGNVVMDLFEDSGCGTFTYQGLVDGTIRGIMPTSDGDFLVWGAYHGYDDGTTNDTTQRMVSRLYGLDVGVQEHSVRTNLLRVWPDPGSEVMYVDWSLDRSYTVEVRDAQGRIVLRRAPQSNNSPVDVSSLASGMYTVQVRSIEGTSAFTKWLKP